MVKLATCVGSIPTPLLERNKQALQKVLFLLGEIMYRTKKYGLVSSKTEHQILAELERDLSREKRHKHQRARRNKNVKSDNR